MIHYQGKDYETREITICPGDMAMTVTVAKNELWERIRFNSMFLHSQEKAIDESIMYYCDDKEWAMSDSELAKLLEDL